jgi:hypothetical protein
VITSAAVSDRLTAAADDDALRRFGFHDDDRADVQSAIADALADARVLDEVVTLTDRLVAAVGHIEDDNLNPFDHPAAADEWHGMGVVPMLALIAAADDTRAYHRSRGISARISERSLSDLGQQTWVHRRTYGAFGLHTHHWLATPFTGNLYWLGRLQFNLVRHAGEWVVSTHIPESGPLTPSLVDDSFRQASAFFLEHFPDYPTRLFHCGSWLLDPQLLEVLRPDSNMALFQRRWTLDGELGSGDGDAIFFVFRRRGDVDLSTLPRDTSLQRAILDKLESGGHWVLWSGTTEQAPYREAAVPVGRASAEELE